MKLRWFSLLQEERYQFIRDKVESKSCLLTADTGYPALSDCAPHAVAFEHVPSLMRKSHGEIEVGGRGLCKKGNYLIARW